MAFSTDKIRQGAAGAGGGGPYGFFAGRDSSETQITQVSFVSSSDFTDWGNLTVRRSVGTGFTDGVGYCYVAGGTIGSGTHYDIIDRWSVTSSGNAVDVGDLTLNRTNGTGTQNSTYGWTSGGYAGYATSTYNVIDRFTFASSSNATDWGDTLNPLGGGCSGGIAFAGGSWDGSYSYRYGATGACGGTWYADNKIARFSQASSSNESQISDFGANAYGTAGINDGSTYAYLAGGNYDGSTSSVIWRYSMGSGTTASSYSDIGTATYVQTTSQGDDVLMKEQTGYNVRSWSMASSSNAAYYTDISSVNGGSGTDEFGYTYFQDPS